MPDAICKKSYHTWGMPGLTESSLGAHVISWFYHTQANMILVLCMLGN